MPIDVQMKKEAFATGRTVVTRPAMAGKSEGFAITKIHEPSSAETHTAIRVNEVARGKSKTRIKVLIIRTTKKSPVITTASVCSCGSTAWYPPKPRTNAAMVETISVGYMKTNFG